eukprot:1195138-Prorocentrum_minimum.AAC.7
MGGVEGLGRTPCLGLLQHMRWRGSILVSAPPNQKPARENARIVNLKDRDMTIGRRRVPYPGGRVGCGASTALGMTLKLHIVLGSGTLARHDVFHDVIGSSKTDISV